VCVAAFWTLNIPMNFITSFYVDGLVEMRPAHIAARYVRRWFVPDLILVCIDWGISLQPGFGGPSSSPVRTVLRLILFVRLLRIIGIYRHLNVVLFYVHLSSFQPLFRIAVKLASILLVNHWVACGWVLVGLSDAEGGWTGLLEDDSGSSIYTMSLHWSLTQFTPAATDIQARSWGERVYSICVILLALVVFSSFVSSITTTMQGLHAQKTDREALEMELRSFCVDHQVSAELGTQMFNVLRTHLSQKQRTHEADLKFLELIPEHLKKQLREELHLPVLLHLPFVEHLRHVDDETVRSVAHTAMIQETYHKGEAIFKAGFRAQHLWFIITGTADYIHRATQSHGTSSVDSFASEASLSTTLLPNMWAGDPALWLVWRYFGDLTGNMPLEVVILDADEFRRVMVKSPRALRCNQTHATLLQMYMKTMNWHTDVWCTAIADLQEMGRLSLTHKILPTVE